MTDEIRFGPRRETRRRWPGWALAATAAVAVVVTLIVTHHGHRVPPRRPSLLAPVRAVGDHLLGVTARWQLITYGPAGLVRILPSSGVIFRTSVPILDSTGPFSFVAGPSQAVVRPLDGVTGYLIPYGHRARPLTGLLASGGMAVPGPRPGQAWMQADFQARALSLTWLDGHRAGPSLPMPHGTFEPFPDGQGYPLVTDVGQVSAPPALFDLRPGGRRRVTGYLLAAGPRRWLTASCGHSRCTGTVIDPASGARRALPGSVPRSELGQPGVISPDGATAALFGVRGNQITLHLISLATGAQRQVPVALGDAPADWQTLAWSPDSRWLFAVAEHGRLVAVRASTGRPQGLGAPLPPVTAIAIQG
jgi:hypothetical protein